MDLAWRQTGLRAFPFVSISLQRSGPFPALYHINEVVQPLPKQTTLEKDRVKGHPNISPVSVQHICDSCKDVNTGNFG